MSNKLTAADVKYISDELAWSDQLTFRIDHATPDMLVFTDLIRTRNKMVRDTLLRASLSDVTVETTA